MTLQWLKLESPRELPKARAFAATGYLANEGPNGLFSVYVVLTSEDPAPDTTQQARLFALVPAMDTSLPAPGERFIITAGVTPVAEALATERGEGPLDDAATREY